MQRKFIFNLLFLIGLNLLIKPLWIIGVDRVVQIRLGFESYGVFYALLNVSYLFNMLLDLGIQNYNVRKVTAEKTSLTQLLPNILVLKLLFSGLYCIITLAAGFVFGFKSPQLEWLLLLALNQCLIFLISYLRSNLAALQFYVLDSLLSVADKFIMLFGVGLLLYYTPFMPLLSIQNFILIQTFSLLITALAAWFAVYRYTEKFRFQSNSNQVLQILKATLPYALLSFLMTLYFRVDSILINYFSGSTENGIYAAAYRLLDMSIMFSYLFATLLLPMFAKLLADKQSVRALTSISSRLLLPLSTLIPISFWFYRNELFQLLYHHEDAYAAMVMGIVMLAFPFISTLYIYGTLLTANGSIKWLNQVAFATAVINIGLNVLLIPRYQSAGAAVAAVIAHAFIAAFNTRKAFTMFNFSLHRKDWLGLAVYLPGSILLFYMGKISALNWLLALSLSILTAILLLFLCGLLPLKKGQAFIQELLSKKQAA